MSIIGKSLSKGENAGIPFGPIPAGENSRGVSAGLKWAVSGAFILALLSLGGSAFLYRSLNTETRERQAFEAAQDPIRSKLANLEKNLQSDRVQIEELQAQLKEHEASQTQFKKIVEDNEKIIAAFEEKLKAAETVIHQIPEPEPEIVTDPASEPEPSVLDLPEEPADEAQPEKQAVQPAAPPPVPAPPAPKPAVSAAPQQPAAAPVKPLAHKPQVLSVNRKFNFVVIGLGIKDGIQMGDAIEVSREGKRIGDAQVEKLYENFAAATIMHEDKEAPIKEGDSIRKSSP